jgi:hypothetical protein
MASGWRNYRGLPATSGPGKPNPRLLDQGLLQPADQANYRLRLLLHSGIRWQTLQTVRLRGRHPRLVALSHLTLAVPAELGSFEQAPAAF